MIKYRNNKDLTETEEIKKKWQEYTEDYAKKVTVIQVTTMVWSLTYSWTSLSEKSSGP